MSVLKIMNLEARRDDAARLLAELRAKLGPVEEELAVACAKASLGVANDRAQWMRKWSDLKERIETQRLTVQGLEILIRVRDDEALEERRINSLRSELEAAAAAAQEEFAAREMAELTNLEAALRAGQISVHDAKTRSRLSELQVRYPDHSHTRETVRDGE